MAHERRMLLSTDEDADVLDTDNRPCIPFDVFVVERDGIEWHSDLRTRRDDSKSVNFTPKLSDRSKALQIALEPVLHWMISERISVLYCIHFPCIG